MNTFQIHCFLHVAKYLNFTEAANHLYVAQSSLSRNISNLEAEIGFPLFIRTKKYVRLTPGGAVMYREFSRILEETDAAIESARNAESGLSGELRLGIIETQQSENFLPHALDVLREKHPHLQIDTTIGNFSSLREAVLNDAIDIAITMSFDLSDFPQDKIVHQDFLPIYARVAVSNMHPLSKMETIDFRQLENDTLIAISPTISHGAYNGVVQLCKQYGFTPEHIITANSIQDLMLKVQINQGYAVLDANCISMNNSALANLKVEKSNVFSLIAVWKRSNLNPIIPSFTSILAEMYETDEA